MRDKGNESATVTQVGAHYKEAQALVTWTSALKSPRRAYNIKLGIDRMPVLCQFQVIEISLDVDVDFRELKVKLHITIQCVRG